MEIVVVDVDTPLKPQRKLTRYEQIKKKLYFLFCNGHFLLPCICCSFLLIFIVALLIVNEIEFSKNTD